MTKAERKQMLKARREYKRVSLHTHLGHSKGTYAKAGVFKQRLNITRESKSINAPVSRLTVATRKDSRVNYKFDTHKHTINSKPKEWIRLNHRDINAVKLITKQKYL